MSDRCKRLLIIFLGLATGALLLLASGLSTVRFSAGDLPRNGPLTFPPPLGLGTPTILVTVGLLLGLLFLVAAVVALVVSLLRRRRRKARYALEYDLGREILASFAAALFFFSLVYLIHATQQLPHQLLSPSVSLPPFSLPPPAAQPIPGRGSEVREIPNWLVPALGGLTFLFVASGLAWLLQRHQSEALGHSNEKQQIAGLAAEATHELESGAPIHDVVLRAYREMSRLLAPRSALAQHRLRELTPREFEEQLERAGVQNDYVGRLTRLFERVRYGEHLADDAERAEALACLRAIESAYGETNHGKLLGTAA